MGLKFYKKRIAFVVVLFTFVPVLFFASVFYGQLYDQRMNYHLSENEQFMQGKIQVLQDEIMSKNRIIRNLAQNIETIHITSHQSPLEIINLFKKRHPEFVSLTLESVEESQRHKDIAYYVSEDKTLFIHYPVEHSEKNQEIIVAGVSVNETVNWLTESVNDVKIAIVSDGKIIYKTDDLKQLTEVTLSSIGEKASLVYLGPNSIPYYSMMRKTPNANMIFYIFRKDLITNDFRQFYIDYIMKILLMIFISIGVTFFVSMRINYPFEKVKRVAKAIIDGEIDAKVENVDDELLNLNLSFNRIAHLHQEKNEEFVQYAMTMLEKNEHLTELNQQLEASYDQLKAITEMLEYSKDKYQALFDHIKEFIWVIDLEGQLTYVNTVMCEKLGFKEEELIDKSFFEVFVRFDEEELLVVDDLIDHFLHRDYNNLSIWFRKANGEEVLVSANSKRIFKNGVLQGAQGTARTVEFEEMLQNRILRKNREFEIVKEITWSLANNKTLGSLLDKVVQKVEALFVPELCTIRIVEGEKLVFKAGIGKLNAYARRDTFSINEDFSGIAIKENRILRIKDFNNTIFYNRKALEPLLEKVQEIIVIPLENKGVIHGTINIGLDTSLRDVEIKILKALANQASIGIEKVKLHHQLKEDFLNTVRVLATAVEAKDKYTEGHSYRVSRIAKYIGQAMSLEEDILEELEIAGMLHDIGKIGIDDEILRKKGSLTPTEYEIMKSHPAVGKRILAPIGLSEDIISGVYWHHKRYDLTGYPEDATIDALGLYPSIIGVADAFDAITSNRTYSSEENLMVALDEINKHKGQQFHPEVVEALEYIIMNDENLILEIIS